jgi:hypothetical protein
VIGKLHEYTEAVLRVRRLPVAADSYFSQLRGGGSGAAAKELDFEIQAKVSGEEEGRPAIFSQVRTIPGSGAQSWNRKRKLMPDRSCIMLNPEFSGSPVLKEFLFS